MESANARSHYRQKQLWQSVHRPVCSWLQFVCGNSYAIFENVHDGSWRASGQIRATDVTSVDEKVDPTELAGEIAVGKQFLEELHVDRACVLFTLVPTVDAPRRSSVEIAKALNGSHLNTQSAERWAGAFFEAAGAKIRTCLGDSAGHRQPIPQTH
jgi:hypothetical protein